MYTDLQKEIRAAVVDAMGGVNGRLEDVEARLSKLEANGKKTAEVLNDVAAVVQTLIEDQRAVLRKTEGRVVLDKQMVYDTAEKEKIGRMNFLRALERDGYLVTEPGPPKRYTKKAKVKGQSIRTIIINLQEV